MGSYHKSENTFHFLTYKEQIKQKIRLSFRRNDYGDDDEFMDSAFANTLDHWTHMNKSDAFSKFRQTIAPYVLNLKLIMLHKNEIIAQLRAFMQTCDKNSSGPILDLVSALSNDLREEFYPFFADFFSDIEKLLIQENQDPELLNHGFNCLSHMIYFLHRCLLKDIESVLKLFITLISHKKAFIRMFTAGCIAFILRKVSTKNLLQLMWKFHEQNENISMDSVGDIFAEILRSIDGKFHSSSVELFPGILDVIIGVPLPTQDIASNRPPKRLRKSIDRTNILSSLDASEFFANCLNISLNVLVKADLKADALYAVAMLYFSRLKSTSSSSNRALLLISCLEFLIDLMQSKRFMHQYEEIFGEQFKSLIVKQPLRPLAQLIIKFVGFTSINFNCSSVMRAILISADFTDFERIQFLAAMIRHKSFKKDFAQSLADLLLRRSLSVPIDIETLRTLARLILVQQPVPSEPAIPNPDSGSNQSQHIPQHTSQLICLSLASGVTSDERLTQLAEWIMTPITTDASKRNLEEKFCVVVCLKHISPLPIDLVSKSLTSETQTTLQKLTGLQNRTTTTPMENPEFGHLSVYLSVVYETWMFFHAATTKLFNDIPFNADFMLLLAQRLKDTDIQLCTVYLRILDLACQAGFLADNAWESITIDSFLPFLLSNSHQIRLHALRILRQLVVGSKGEWEDRVPPLIALDRCLETELIKQSPTSLRELLSSILHLHCGRTGIFDSPVGAKVAIHYLLGLLHVNLTPAWTGIVAAVSSYLNPIFYFESADSLIQPKDSQSSVSNRKQPKNRKKSGAVEYEHMNEDVAEGKPLQTHITWKQDSKELFWSTITELMTRPMDTPSSIKSTSDVFEFDKMDVGDAYLAQLCIIPDEAVASLVADSPMSVGQHRPADWSHYRLNLWRCITPGGVGKHARLLISLFLAFVRDEFYGKPSKSNEDVLVCALNLFGRMPNLQSAHGHDDLSVTLLRLLTNKRPTVQQATFKCWINLSPTGLTPYKEHFENVLALHSFRDAVRVFKLDTSVVAEHRKAVAPILIRILYGRLHLTKENLVSAVFTNLAGCSDSELEILLSLIVDSFFSALGLESGTEEGYDSIDMQQAEPNWSRLQAICQMVQDLLSYMCHRLGGLVPPSDITELVTISSDCHTPTLFRIAMLMLSIVNGEQHDGEEEEKEKEQPSKKKPHSKQVKVVRRTGVSILLHLLSAPGIEVDTFWSPERIKRLNCVVLAPNLRQLRLAAVASPKHLVIRLALVWSQNRHLIQGFFSDGVLMDELMHLLSHPKVSREVARALIEVICNLVFSTSEIEEAGRSLMAPFHDRLIDYLYHRMLSLRSMSASEARKTLNSTSTSDAVQREFRLLNYLSDGLTGEQASKLLSGLLPFLVKGLSRPPISQAPWLSKKRRGVMDGDTPKPRQSEAEVTAKMVGRETTEAEILRVLCRLMEVTNDIADHLSKVLELFSKVDSRISRSLLCSAAGIAASRLPPPPTPSSVHSGLADFVAVKPGTVASSKMPPGIYEALRLIRGTRLETKSVSPGAQFERHVIYKLLSMLNSWSTTHLDQADSDTREAGLVAFMGLCELLKEEDKSKATTNPQELSFFVHLAGVHCALYTLQTAEIQLRDMALDYLNRLAALLADRLDSAKGDDIRQKAAKNLIKRLIIGPLWQGLCRNVKLAMGPRRQHFFRLLSGLVKVFPCHAFFAPLALLASSDQHTCFFANLQSGTSARQLFAVRRLALFLQNPLTIVSKKAISKCIDSEKEDIGHFVIPLPHLRGIILPLLLFFIRQELNVELATHTLGQEARLMLSACFEAVRALATRLTWSPYQELLSSAMTQLDLVKESTVALRYTLAVIDGFQVPNWAEPLSDKILTFMLGIEAKMQSYIVPPSGGGFNKNTTGGVFLRTNAVVALVTLLRRLPKGKLEARLPHLVLRVADILRPTKKLPSSARHEAVCALSKVAIMIGPGKGLDSLFSTLSRELGKGYTAMTIRLASLHRIFLDLVDAINKGDVLGTCNLDNVCQLLFRLYLDEIAGSLGEQTDSRREALQSFSATSMAENQSSSSLPVSSEADLPEAKGSKAPAGLPTLLRFMSTQQLKKTFNDLKTATSLVASGRIISNESLAQHGRGDDVKSDNKLINHLRFRKRALTRLQVVLNRIPTKQGLLHPKMTASHLEAGQIAIDLIIPPIEQPKTSSVPSGLLKRGPSALYRPGWGKAGTTLLETRPDYMTLLTEPKLSTQNMHATQTASSQTHMLVNCGLQTLLGLLRLNLLSDPTQLAKCVPVVVDSLSITHLSVLASGVRCIRIFFHLGIVDEHIPAITSALFSLLDSHAGLLSTGTTARDANAQSFAHGLYSALAGLIRHQSRQPLSKTQLSILFSTIETEIVRDAATSPALALLLAILHRRLRDPTAMEKDDGEIKFSSEEFAIPEDDVLLQGLAVAKRTDEDFSLAGAGGGPRLSGLMLRLQRMAITSSNEVVRRDCRRCLIAYLVNYPHQRRFINAFVGFMLRQLEVTREFGRSSVASLLSLLVAELPALTGQGGLAEIVLLSVGAAIERESSASVRLALFGILRLLFTRIPSDTAVALYQDYLIAFLRAPADTRASARLLGLQLVAVILGSQDSLSIEKRRLVLLNILGSDILKESKKQLTKLLLTHRHLFKDVSGQALDTDKSSKPEAEANEDDEWMTELEIPNEVPVPQQMEMDESEEEEEDDLDDEVQEEEKEEVENILDDDPLLDLDGASKAELAADEAVKVVKSCVIAVSEKVFLPSKSASELHFVLVNCTLEHGLRLVHRLLIGDDREDDSTATTSSLSTPIWHALTCFDASSVKKAKKKKTREAKYSKLLMMSSAEIDDDDDAEDHSLLLAPTRSVREWAAHCLNLLLKAEMNNCRSELETGGEVTENKVKFGFQSEFLKSIQMKQKSFTALMSRLLMDSLKQFEIDSRSPMSEAYANSVLSNLICLGQLENAMGSHKQVLRIFRTANRLALDELNNRKFSFNQRILAVKLTTGLLLKLPKPSQVDMETILRQPKALSRVTEKLDNEDDEAAHPPSGSTRSLLYLKSALHLLARESRQKERLAYLATSAVALPSGLTGVDAEESALAGRKLSSRLSKVDTTRAKQRRKKAQAKMRRALLSGDISASEAARRMSNVPMVELASADNLIGLVESSELAIAKALGNQNMTTLYARSALSLTRKRDKMDALKATHSALGGPTRDNDSFLVAKRSKNIQT